MTKNIRLIHHCNISLKFLILYIYIYIFNRSTRNALKGPKKIPKRVHHSIQDVYNEHQEMAKKGKGKTKKILPPLIRTQPINKIT